MTNDPDGGVSLLLYWNFKFDAPYLLTKETADS